MKNPVFFRRIVSGVTSGKSNKLYSASAAMVHHPIADDKNYATAKSKQTKQKI